MPFVLAILAGVGLGVILFGLTLAVGPLLVRGR